MVSASARKAPPCLFGMILLAALLPGMSSTREGERDVEMSVNMNDGAEGMGVNSSVSWSPWEVKFTGLSCIDINTTPFSGLQTAWPSCMKSAKEQGEKLAKTRNCKACDVTFTGSKPEAETRLMSTKCKPLVQCSAGTLDPSKTCFATNGRLEMVHNMNHWTRERTAHPNRACYPCPPECKVCIFDNSYTNAALKKKRFKCVMPGGGSGSTCQPPAGVECGECSHRRCSGVGNRMLGKAKCDNNDFKADCKWKSTFEIPSDPHEYAVDKSIRKYAVTMESGGDSFVLPPVLTTMMQGS